MAGTLVRNGDHQYRRLGTAKRNSLENMRNWERGTVGPGLAVCPRAKLTKLRRTVLDWILKKKTGTFQWWPDRAHKNSGLQALRESGDWEACLLLPKH